MKRLVDVFISVFLLVLIGPILLAFMVLVWRQDGKSPFYLAPRVARGGGIFRMVKLRSMVVDADKSGVNSTKIGDTRVTKVGEVIRKFKLDELTQLWNVFIGDMSLVGPRPNTYAWGVDLYTPVEMALISVRPGITDFASIIFSDEGEILAGSPNPDITYNQLIRPWKSRLGLFYIEKQSFKLDIQLVALTALTVFSRRRALLLTWVLLRDLGAPSDLIKVAQRSNGLVPTPPPGASEVAFSN